MLKCTCQTDPVKNVAWHTAAAGDGTGIPREFQTTSQVCIIANDGRSADANVAAVEDRGHLVVFDPTPEEVHKQVATWFWDQQVYDWMADHLHLIPELSMRHYVRAYELKRSGIDFVKVFLSDEIPDKAILIARLKADDRFTQERDRVAEFRRLGGGNATTWYKWAGRIRSPYDTAELKLPLTAQPPDRRAA
ncbi:MAG: hypothetical protein R3E01_35305 [Pirellulaceae bacterium]